MLRKSFRQLTPLHLYHHVSITLVARDLRRVTLTRPTRADRPASCAQTAAFLRYCVNGDTYLPALANSFVHVLMYSHYLLAAFGVRRAHCNAEIRAGGAELYARSTLRQVETFWKKQLTTLQLIQFLGVMAQSVLSLMRGSDCGFPDWLKARYSLLVRSLACC